MITRQDSATTQQHNKHIFMTMITKEISQLKNKNCSARNKFSQQRFSCFSYMVVFFGNLSAEGKDPL